MGLVELTHRHAKRRLAPSRLAAAVQTADGSWARAEATLQRETLASPRRARRLVTAFAEVAAAHGGAEARGRAARLAGSFEAYVGRFAASLPRYAAAARQLRGSARDAARLGSAAALLRLGRFDEAIATCRGVRRAARRRGEDLLAAAADLNEAVARHEGGDPSRALPLYARAERAFLAASRPALVATALQNRANALVLLDRFAEAEPLYRRAQLAFDDLGVANEAARCRYNSGALLAATDRLGAADTELRAAERQLAAAGDARHAALARLDRAEVLLRAGLAEEARDLASRARRAMGRGVPPVERRRAALIEARALLVLGRGRAVRTRLGRPLPGGSRRDDAERLELLARAAGLDDRHARAAAGLRDAARAHRRAGHPVGAARALCAAAWSARAAGAATAARRDLRSAERALRAVELPSARHAIEAVRFLLEADAGRRAAADRSLEAALHALELVRDGLGADAFRAAALRGRAAWFARAVRHVLDGPGGAPAALELLERWRARALRDLLAGAADVADGSGSVDELRARILRLERSLGAGSGPALLRTRNPAPPAAARELAAAERRLRESLRLRATGTADDVDHERLQRSLPPGTLVLSLFADDDGTLLFSMTRDALRTVRTSTPTARIAQMVEALRFQLGQHELGQAFVARHVERLERRTVSLLRELGDATYGPLAEQVTTARRVIVIPHGPWYHAPLAALHVGGAPLLAQTDVALTPALGALQRRNVRARGAPVVLAAADTDAPSIADEARRVSRLLGCSMPGRRETGFDELLRRRSPSTLHVAAHGRYRADAPALSGVRLTDGWLRAAEFPRLHLRGSTVVLSGCETGLSPARAGDEVQGLVRGVFASGAAELVASLWRVDDPSTAELMVRLHRARRNGATTERALCAAQRALRQRGCPVWSWAGFQIWTRRLR